jgi:proline iminopeptidase
MKKVNCLLLLISLFLSCNQSTTGPHDSVSSSAKDSAYVIKDGGCRMIAVGGKYHVWTKKVGDGKIKVLLLHGGPGFSHDYMECFEDFLPNAGIEFYYYDQLGCGNSDKPSDTTLWNIPRYIEEVEEVRKGLGLDSFYLFGHSWGSMLAMEYLQKYQLHVKGAVLSDMTAGTKSYLSYTAALRKRFFGPADNTTYDSLDKLKLYQSDAYQNLLMNKLYIHVICQLPVDQWPEPLIRAFKKSNPVIYIQMQGVDEFHVTGNIKHWEMWDSLHNITVPTLVIGGMNDEMNPDDMKREGKLIPNSRTYLCPNGSHMSMYDDQQHYFTSLVGFLKDVDENKFTPDKK